MSRGLAGRLAALRNSLTSSAEDDAPVPVGPGDADIAAAESSRPTADAAATDGAVDDAGAGEADVANAGEGADITSTPAQSDATAFTAAASHPAAVLPTPPGVRTRRRFGSTRVVHVAPTPAATVPSEIPASAAGETHPTALDGEPADGQLVEAPLVLANPDAPSKATDGVEAQPVDAEPVQAEVLPLAEPVEDEPVELGPVEDEVLRAEPVEAEVVPTVEPVGDESVEAEASAPAEPVDAEPVQDEVPPVEPEEAEVLPLSEPVGGSAVQDGPGRADVALDEPIQAEGVPLAEPDAVTAESTGDDEDNSVTEADITQDQAAAEDVVAAVPVEPDAEQIRAEDDVVPDELAEPAAQNAVEPAELVAHEEPADVVPVAAENADGAPDHVHDAVTMDASSAAVVTSSDPGDDLPALSEPAPIDAENEPAEDDATDDEAYAHPTFHDDVPGPDTSATLGASAATDADAANLVAGTAAGPVHIEADAPDGTDATAANAEPSGSATALAATPSGPAAGPAVEQEAPADDLPPRTTTILAGVAAIAAVIAVVVGLAMFFGHSSDRKTKVAAASTLSSAPLSVNSSAPSASTPSTPTSSSDGAAASLPAQTQLSRWAKANLSPAAVIVADAKAAKTLRADGFTDVVPDTSTSTDWHTVAYLIRSRDGAHPSAFRTRLADAAAPLALFGTGASEVTVSEVHPEFGASLAARVKADRVIRKQAGLELVKNSSIRLSPSAETTVRAGQLDIRAASFLVQLARTTPVYVISIVCDPAETRAGRPCRTIIVSTGDMNMLQQTLSASALAYKPETVQEIDQNAVRLQWIPAIVSIAGG